MSAFDELYQQVRVADDPSATAEAMMYELDFDRPQRDVVAPLFLAECDARQRETDRDVERRAARRGVPDRTASRIDELFTKSFAIGDGRRVRWAVATVDDHAARIAYLAKMQRGIEDTIAFHEKVRAKLLEHGVSCMEDLPREDLDELGSPPTDDPDTGEAAA